MIPFLLVALGFLLGVVITMKDEITALRGEVDKMGPAIQAVVDKVAALSANQIDPADKQAIVDLTAQLKAANDKLTAVVQ